MQSRDTKSVFSFTYIDSVLFQKIKRISSKEDMGIQKEN